MATATKPRTAAKAKSGKPAAAKPAAKPADKPNLKPDGKEGSQKPADDEAAKTGADTQPDPEIAPDEPEIDVPEDFLTIDKTGTPFVQAYSDGRYIEFAVIEITALEQSGDDVVCHLSGTTIQLTGSSSSIADLFQFVRQFAAARRNAR